MAKGSDNPAGRRLPSHNTKPYDANNSFVRKMATKVTDLIQPSWISKWFNTSQSNVLDNREDIEEEMEFEDDAQAPPSKRSRIRMDVTHPPGTFSIQTRVKTGLNTVDLSKEQYPVNEMSEDFPEPATAGPSGIGRLMSSTPATQADIRTVTSHRSDLNSLTSPINNGIANGTDDNSESSESTSGCSSLIPQINRHEGPSNLLYSSTFTSRKRHIDDKLTFTNHLQSPRSLFLDSNSRDTLSSRRPSFNASVMTNALDRSSPLSSPFYSGNITFGGANAAGLYKRGRNLFNNSSELQLKVPRRANVEVKLSNAAGVDSSGMSQTAKKILEALEHFSSPISDAKKIPLKRSSNTASSIMSRKRAREEITSPSARIGLRHMTRELTVPTVPDILKLKRRQKLQDTTVAARKIVSARSDPPPLLQEYRLRTENGENEKYRGKLIGKSKINLEQEETVMPVNLPNIPLPITTLPNFNFALPPPAAHISGANIANKDNTFTFASPIKVMDAGKSLQSVNNFTFSNPIDAEDTTNNTSNSNTSLVAEIKESTGFFIDRAATSMPNFLWSTSSTAPRLKAKVKNSKSDNVGFVMACELKSGSVMDILCPKDGTGSNLIGQSNAKLASETIDKTAVSMDSCNRSTYDDTESFWECSDCMIKNHGTNKRCVACKLARSNPEDKTPPPSSTKKPAPKPNPITNVSFGSQFKLAMDQWECTICCVRNKRTDAKCMACSAPKPARGPTLQQIVESNQKSDLMEKFKPDEGSWECSGCLLRNTASLITCICCNASKPDMFLKAGSKKMDTVVDSSAQKLNVTGTEDTVRQDAATSASDIMNKFKPSKDSWECPGCLVRNGSSVTTCPCCNTAKPCSDGGTSKAEQMPTNKFGDKFKKPEGSWTCDSCMLQNDAKHAQCVACEAAKPGTTKSNEPASKASTIQFKFGVLSDASAFSNPPAGGFKFGIDKADQSKSDAASPLNGFKFGSAQSIGGTVQFTFGIPKEENNAAKEPSKTNGVASSGGTGFLFNLKKLEPAKQDQETKRETSHGVPPHNKMSIAGEKSGTSTMFTAATTTPLFTFGAQRSTGFNQPVSSVEAQKVPSASVTDGSRSVTTTATIPAVSTAITSANTIPVSSATVLPSIPAAPSKNDNVSDAKPAPIFSFGTTSSISTAANNNNTSTNTTTTCLPAFAQASFAFSNSKVTPKAATIPAFGQVPTPSAALSTKMFGGNKIPETTASPSGKPVNTTPGATIFPIVSSPTSLFNSSESKTTTSSAFGMDKPSMFSATSKPSSGFAMADNKITAFGNTGNESKPSIFGTSDTAKLPAFSSPVQTSVASPLSGFNASSSSSSASASNAAPSLFGSSSTPAFGNNNTATFGGTATTSAIFSSSTKPSLETTNAASNPSLFTFGSSSQQPSKPAGGFNFSAGAGTAGTGTKQQLFTFGSGTAGTSQPGGSSSSGSGSTGTSGSSNVFGSGTTFGAGSNAANPDATSFAFNPAKQEAPPGASAFGQSSAVAAPIFGGPQATSQAQATPSFSSTTSSGTGFSFGSATPAAATPAPGGFNFGGMPSTSTPGGGFNFNPPTSTPGVAFDPNSRPSFNFTKGSAPTSFNAPPQSAAAPRKIKKAFRRCMR